MGTCGKSSLGRLVPVLTVRALVGASPLHRRAGENRRLGSLVLVAFVRNSFESMRNRIVSRASVIDIGMPTGATAGAGDAGVGAGSGAGTQFSYGRKEQSEQRSAP
jgi:hypothetical protein